MTAGFAIRPTLRVVSTKPEPPAPLSTLDSIAIESIAQFWLGGPENRRLALLAADENLAHFRSSRP